MENKNWKEDFEEKYCSFEISERVSKPDMLAIKSFIESLLKSKQEEIEKTIERTKCEVPKNPLPKGKRDLGEITFKKIDDCLKYAGRINYNKAIDDLKPIISNLLK